MNRLEKKFQRYNLALGLVLAAVVGVAGPLVAAAAASNPVAILDSARTKTYFRLHYGYCVANSADPNAVGEMEYKRYWGGWEEVLKELKAAGTIPGYDIVTDSFITNGLRRSKYKVLILSNNANMSQPMVDAIRSWVAGGGRLLATFGSGYEAAADSVDEALKSKPNKDSLEQLWNDPLTKYITTGIFGTVSVEGTQESCPLGYPGGSVEAILTQTAGPTANYCQFYQAENGAACPWYFDLHRLVTGYGDLAIMLLGRSENWPGSYAHFQFANNLTVFDPNPPNCWEDTEYSKPLPAVVASSYRKGRAVYYAFAPEFIVGLEFDAAGHCEDDLNYPGGDPAPWQQEMEKSKEHNLWVGRTPELRALMKSSIYYLLTTP
ncbi:MAG: hypothetical protein HYX73_03505 [Acidobacteria bacterium]|nr:hypothetical protein [Acidobacteriota bacterium]